MSPKERCTAAARADNRMVPRDITIVHAKLESLSDEAAKLPFSEESSKS